MSPEHKALLDFISTTGIPGALLLLLVWTGLKYLPKLARSWAAQAAQANALAKSLPEIQNCLERMAAGGETSVSLQKDSNKKLDQALTKLDQLLKLATKEA